MKPKYEKYELKQIGARIKRRRTELGMTQPELAAMVGLSAPSISKYENGKVGEASLKTMEELAEALEAPVGWLLDGAERMSPDALAGAKAVPVLGKTAAGAPIFAEEQHDEYALAAIDENVDFAVRIQGDSMINARIFDGDILYARAQQSVQNGEIAIVVIDDGDENRVTTKRFYKYGGTIVLRSENPVYKDIEITRQSGKTVRVIGKAVFLKTYVN